MNKTKKVFGTVIVLAVLAIFVVSAVPAVNAATAYFVPEDSSAEPGGYAYVKLYVDIVEGETLGGGQTTIIFNPANADITKVSKNCNSLEDDTCFNNVEKNLSYTDNGYAWSFYYNPLEWDADEGEWIKPPGNYFTGPRTVKLCRFKVEAVGTPGVSQFNFGFGQQPSECPICQFSMLNGQGGTPLDNVTWINGTFTHEGEIPSETLEKGLVSGWNLISLCFEPSDNSTNAVLSSISGNYSAVTEWDASSHNWVEATTMDRGKGYFVYVTTACMWNHTGVNKTNPMTIPLEPGLNLVGYPFNKTSTTSDALSALNYYYAAPFDATDQKYVKTFNPVVPAPFSDFTTINPCEGFWVSSKDGGDWTAS